MISGYDEWKDALVTLHLSNGEVLSRVRVIDLKMTPDGLPHTLQVPHLPNPIDIPFGQVAYYVVHKEQEAEEAVEPQSDAKLQMDGQDIAYMYKGVDGHVNIRWNTPNGKAPARYVSIDPRFIEELVDGYNNVICGIYSDSQKIRRL